MTGYRFAEYRLRASGFGLQDCGLRTAGFGLRASGFGLRALGFGTADCGLPASGFGLRASGCQPPASALPTRGRRAVSDRLQGCQRRASRLSATGLRTTRRWGSGDSLRKCSLPGQVRPVKVVAWQQDTVTSLASLESSSRRRTVKGPPMLFSFILAL